MDITEGECRSTPNENVVSKERNSTKTKTKSRGKKRKRRASGSSSEYEDALPDNTMDVEKNVHASAVKNNLDESSVRKILKKVVTNDRVLALVKLREKTDDSHKEDSLQPKLTRAKVKELMRVSPKTSSSAWNLENLELTPIKHIPVKTRPEVKALIAQELPEDEDDEEYEPTNEDVPSDDDQAMESCSDLDSQPRTPATPLGQNTESPKVVKDGPFKVPQDLSTPSRRKLNLEEEATIALRTRSKLSLSATSIEHIESTFVPPDELPMPAVDDLWNQFLNECLNPASTSKHEDDDEADPEYNVAADPDAHDEDEEALGNGIIKISKKELNDLVTELFNIMPEATVEDELMADNLTSSVLTEHSQTEASTRWEGKQEPLSDDENRNRQKLSDRITFEKKGYSRVSIGKMEPSEPDDTIKVNEISIREKEDASKEKNKQPLAAKKAPPVVKISVEERETSTTIQDAPPLLQNLKTVRRECVLIQVDKGLCILPEQIQILQQQIRQHVQLSTCHYLQLYVHPVHWSYAPSFKEYLETFGKMVDANPKSVANVCNLEPALELMNTWEKTVSADTQENRQMIEFIQSESDRCLRRSCNKNLYVGEFHETFKKVVANSPVFLYPYLLPSMPFRSDTPRRFCYLQSEDELIALGLDQFWQYVCSNPSIYKPRTQSHPRQRWGLGVTVQLIVKHMFPWISVKLMHSHIQSCRKMADKDNAIHRFFEDGKVTPVQHKLLPYNPQLTLYEQPEHEFPRIWVRYLAKTSKRFRKYLMKRTNVTGVAPTGVAVELGQAVRGTTKAPLSIDFTKQIISNRALLHPTPPKPTLTDKFDVEITEANQPQVVSNVYKFVETSTGAYLMPVTSVTMTVNSNDRPIVTPAEINSSIVTSNVQATPKIAPKEKNEIPEHCTCCVLLRKICKEKQTVITDYFSIKKSEKKCECRGKRYPKVSNRLRLLVNSYKNKYDCALQALQTKIKLLVKGTEDNVRLNETYNSDSDIEDLAYVTSFHLKLLTRTALAKDGCMKKKVYTLLSKFNPYEHDPLTLASKLDQAFGNELVDIYKEFLGFLTPEQADKIDAFKDYFIRNCITGLVKKVEMEVSEERKRRNILEELKKVYIKNLSTACEICTDILSTLDGYPKLAEYVHSLFPHRKEESSRQEKDIILITPQETEQPIEKNSDDTAASRNDSTVLEKPTINNEDDETISEEENITNSGNDSPSEDLADDIDIRPIKIENTSSEYETPTSENVSMVITVSKTEVLDFNESSNTSMKLMFEDELIKSEGPEWKREEDKLILELLKEHLTPEERQDKTILEIIEEKHIVDIISERLTHKSKSDIKTRLLYLLQLC